MNWQDELLLWTPLPRFDNIGELYFLFTEMRMDERLETINEWYKKGGILTVSYDLLRQMIANKPKKPDKVAPLDEARHGKLVDQLIDGPNIIIADEAHRMKNLNSRTSEVTSRFASRSRVALTGSPLANNLKEYFAMIDWISPGYLGDFTEFKSRFQDPIEHGLYSTSSKGERRAALKLLQVLKIILEPKIHRADITVLKGSLKPKVEFVISVSLTPLQEDAYKLYVRHLSTSSVESVSVMRVWSWLAVLSLLCNHPKVFLEKLQEQTKDSSKMKSRAAVSYDTQTDRNLSDEQISNALETLGDEHVSKIGLPSGLIHEQEQLIRREPDVRSPRHSQKVVLFMQILSLSKIADDKVLVFSHSIPTLDYLEALFLEKDISYSRLDGKTKMGLRNAMAHDFNKGKTDVFLISTRAGGLGFNLPGANRVVLFDFNFNPTWEEQAIGRAYRIGQEKPVYVYRFISAGTFETNVYNKAVFKTQLASRVVDKKNPKSHASKSKDYLYEPRHTPLEDVSGVIGKDPVVLDQILAARRQKNDTHIRSITTTETLQADAGDDLTEAELQEVYKMREEENLRKDNPQLYDARRVAAQMALINESARTIRVNSMQMSVDSSRPVGTLPNVVPNVGVVNQVPPPVREVQAPRTSNTVPNGNLPMNSLGISGGVVPIPQNYGLADTTNVQATSNSKPRNATDDMQKSTNTTAQQMKIDAPNVPTVPAKLSKDMQNNAIAAGQHRQNDVQQIPTSISQKAINDAQNSSKSEHVKNVSPNSLTGVTKHPEDSTQAKPNTAVPSVKAGTEKKSSTITSLSKAASESKISLTDQQAKSRTRNVPFTAQSEPPPVGNASSAQSASIGKTERRAAYSRANWRLKNTPFSYEEEAPKRKPGRPRKSELSIAEAVANYKRKIATVVKENDVVSTTAEEGSGGRIGANSSKPISAPTSGGGMKSKGPASRPDSGSSSGSGSGSAFASAPSSRPVSSSRPDAGSRLGSLNGKRSMSDVNGARNADNKTAKAKNNSESQDTVESTSPPDECVIS